MALDRPVFTLDKPNPDREHITDALWWLWLRLDELERDTLLGGILAWKPHFHAPGNWNLRHAPDSYSVRDKVNRTGPGMTHASALDWTFPDAQRGDYRKIDKYTSRLVASALDPRDPRLDLVLHEFYGQADSDPHVEGYNELHERPQTSDPSHLWHIHLGLLRSKVGDYWAMWALLTVLMGWSVAQWRASLPAPPPPPAVPPVEPIGKHAPGSRLLSLRATRQRGDDVLYVQRWIGPRRCGKADGVFGPNTAAGVRWYQQMRGIKPVTGKVDAVTWRNMGVRWTGK
jgi:peptidoglycan hydrolase-like protein with peptidoglycan-binding domain